MSDRVLAVGQWLGTGNHIVRMEWFERTGWTATDWTGERYQQYPSRRQNIGGFPDGLKTADEPADCTQLPRTPWPPAPKDEQ
jgi:hypothetical protein